MGHKNETMKVKPKVSVPMNLLSDFNRIDLMLSVMMMICMKSIVKV